MIKVLNKTDNLVEFSVDDGPRDSMSLKFLEKAQNKDKPLEIAIAQELGLDLDNIPVNYDDRETEEPSGVSLSDVKDMFSPLQHSHSGLYSPTDHSHDKYAVIEHGHTQFQQLASAVNKLATDVSDAHSGIDGLRRDMRLHKHDVPEHPHPSMNAMLDAVVNDIRTLSERDVAMHEHKELASLQVVADAVNQLNQAIHDLRTWARERDEELSNRIPEMPIIPPQGLSEIEVIDLIKEQLDAPSRRTPVVLLSKQEVAGKTRFILEEQ